MKIRDRATYGKGAIVIAKTNEIATAADFSRMAAQGWLALPGIEKLPSFQTVCREIVENDDDWFKKNRARIQEIETSRDVRHFLIECGQMNLAALGVMAKGEDDVVREAATRKLSEPHQREKMARLLKGMNELLLSKTFLILHLFDDAKIFLKTARFYASKDEHKSRTFVRASVIIAFTALEAFVNTLSQFLAEQGKLELHERSFLQDQRLEPSDEGYFKVCGQRFNRLEQKIMFLHWKLTGVPIDKHSSVWGGFISAKKLRDEIVHPKPRQVNYAGLTVGAAESALKAVLGIGSLLYATGGEKPDWILTLEPSSK